MRQSVARRDRYEKLLNKIKILVCQKKALTDKASRGPRSGALQYRAQLGDVVGTLKELDPDQVVVVEVLSFVVACCRGGQGGLNPF